MSRVLWDDLSTLYSAPLTDAVPVGQQTGALGMHRALSPAENKPPHPGCV
jgi:hypothetical protein